MRRGCGTDEGWWILVRYSTFDLLAQGTGIRGRGQLCIGIALHTVHLRHLAGLLIINLPIT